MKAVVNHTALLTVLIATGNIALHAEPASEHRVLEEVLVTATKREKVCRMLPWR